MAIPLPFLGSDSTHSQMWFEHTFNQATSKQTQTPQLGQNASHDHQQQNRQSVGFENLRMGVPTCPI